MTRCPTFQTPSPSGGCDGCGKPLPKYARRWCSGKCSDGYWNNHGWNAARFAAKMRTVIGEGWGKTVGPFCDECGVETQAVEINHVEPRNGEGYGEGCWNHQTNLQVLCHACHVAETNRQASERRGLVRAVGTAAMVSLWDVAS